MNQNRYLKLTEKPGLSSPGNPTCQACLVEVDYGDETWVCPSCGTEWPGDRMESSPEEATLYEEWSGDTLEGPECPSDIAYLVSGYAPRERDQAIKMRIEQLERLRENGLL